MRRLLFRILTFFRPRRADAELNRELASHLRLLEDDFVSTGMSRDEAHFAARRAFGGQIEQVKLRQRDVRSFRLLDESWLGLKLGARMAVKYPGLTVIAVVALSVAIGAGAAHLEFVNDLLHGRLPIEDGDRIVLGGALEVSRGAGVSMALISGTSIALFITAITLLACVVPVRRALRVHPTDALRADA